MAEESRWSHFSKSFRDSLTLVREVAILAILAVLIFDASRITPILTKIGLALEKAGFTEVSIGGVKQDLKRLREKIEDTGLNAEQAQESLTKAITVLQKVQNEQLNTNVASSIKDAISLISSSQTHLGFAKQQIQEVTSATTPRTDTQTQPVPSASKPWAVVVGADRTLKAAQDEVRLAKSKGFENAKILLRGNQYRTVIPFATEKEADDKLPQISKQIREGSYVRDLNKWCAKLEPTESEEGKFEKCTLREEG